MIDYEYYYEQYRYVPRNSATTQKDLVDYHSTVSSSTDNIWAESIKQPVATTYIDGSILSNLHKSPYSVKDLFPKGRCRRKPLIPCEKKISASNRSKSYMPAEKTNVDTKTVRSEKTLPLLTMTSTLPDVQKNTSSNQVYSAVVLNEKDSEAKFYARRATTHANGGWVRRYISINQSQILTSFLRDQAFRNPTVHRKRTRQQSSIFSSSSVLSSNSSFDKRRRQKC